MVSRLTVTSRLDIASRVGATRSNLPQNYEMSEQITLLDDFSDISTWTKTATDTANADVTEDTTHVKYGTKSFKFATTASVGKNAYVTKNETFSLNDKPGFWVIGYKAYALPSANSLGAVFYLSHQTALGAGAGRWTTTQNTVSITPGWFGLFIQKGDWSILDGAPDFANDILSWRFRIDSAATETHEFYIDSVQSIRTRPKVIITFDDGWDTSYTNAHSYTQPLGFPLTHYLIGVGLDTANYITTAQAETMKAAGDYIGVHGASSWNTGGLNLMKSDIAKLGDLTDGLHAAWPNGDFGGTGSWPSGYENSDACGFLTNRAVSPRIMCPLAFDHRSLNGVDLASGTTLAAAKAWVDEAIASGGTLIFYAHKIDAVADSLTWVTADFQALVDYILLKKQNGLLDIETISSWYNGLSEPRLS